MGYLDSLKNRAQHSVLEIYDLRTKARETVAEFDEVVEAPNWTKDGTSLVCNSHGRLFAIDLSTKKITEIDTGIAAFCNNDHVLGTRGNRIAVSAAETDEGLSRIYIVDPETHTCDMKVPHPHSYLHGWSPDGTLLAFCGAREYGGKLEWDVYTADAENGKETRLTFSDGLNDGPEFSADGRYIWFNSVRTGRMQVWRMKTDGSEQTQMTFDTERNNWFPHISPDMTKVVYLSYSAKDLLPGEHLPDKNVEIRMIPAEGGKEETLLSLFGGQGSVNVNSWSPDSTKFAFVSYWDDNGTTSGESQTAAGAAELFEKTGQNS